MSSISAIAGSMMVGTKKTCVVPYACTASAKYRSPVMRGMVISYLKEDGPRGKVELRPAEQPRGHEQRRVAEAEAGTDQRLEQGSAGAGDAQRHASPPPTPAAAAAATAWTRAVSSRPAAGPIRSPRR